MPPLTRYKPWTCPCGKKNDGEYFRCQKCQKKYQRRRPPIRKRRPRFTPAEILTVRKMLGRRSVAVVAFTMGVSHERITRIKKLYGPIYDNPEVKVMK